MKKADIRVLFGFLVNEVYECLTRRKKVRVWSIYLSNPR